MRIGRRRRKSNSVGAEWIGVDCVWTGEGGQTDSSCRGDAGQAAPGLTGESGQGDVEYIGEEGESDSLLIGEGEQCDPGWMGVSGLSLLKNRNGHIRDPGCQVYNS